MDISVKTLSATPMLIEDGGSKLTQCSIPVLVHLCGFGVCLCVIKGAWGVPACGEPEND